MRMELKMEKMSQKALERKSNKPIMEKKRRARINHCLNQLKALILEADNERSRHSKLEKADILEMTVKYLQTLRAYHVHLNQINQLQQSQQHQQLQHHFQRQLKQHQLAAPQLIAAAAANATSAPQHLQLAGSAPSSPIDLQMPVSLAQLPLPLQLSLQAAAASHQLAPLSPEASPKSCASSRPSPSSSASSGVSSTSPATSVAHHHTTSTALQQAHQNQQQQQHFSRHLASHPGHQHQLHLSHQQLQQHGRHHAPAQISPTWRPW